MHITRFETDTVSAAAAPGQHGARLALSGASKSYGTRRVLDKVDLQLEPGEFVAVIGRSGCGKSTLLRAIAGLEQLDAGSISVGQGGATPEVRMMFQEARLLPWKSVLDNVALGLTGAIAQASETLAAVALRDRAGDWPALLSGGQRQRVALARALVHRPRLLLLDEPLGALDALTRIDMQQLIESLWIERGFTAVLVTHDVTEALALADRVLLIEEGRIGLDLRVELPRGSRRGTAAFAELEQRLLARVLGQELARA